MDSNKCININHFEFHSTPLLDKVMSRNQSHIGMHQHHLMFKGH